VLTFTAPVINYRAQNPATIFVKDGAVEMGETIPTYNGTPCIQLQAQHVASPICQYQHNLAPGVITLGGITYRSAALVTGLPAHTIASPVDLPPAPVGDYWMEPNVLGARIVELLTMICQKRERSGQGVNEGLDPRKNNRLIDPLKTYTFKFKIEPDGQSFMSHIEFHEYQHIADHRWLAQQIIGRWDSFLSDLHQGGNAGTRKMVVSTRPQGTLGLANGFTYSIGVPRIMMYWARVAAYSGDLYHDTDQGAPPVLRVEQVAGDDVIVVLRAKQMLTERPDILNPKPHREMAVKSQNIDGTEMALGYGAPGPFPPVTWRQLTDRHWCVP
jgi:hypothetical protein